MNDRDAYLTEYSSENVVKVYSAQSAGRGIQYNLAHVYGKVYSDTLDAVLSHIGGIRPISILEYGCGAGMNLIYLVRLLMTKKIPLEKAIGTDFSQRLIEAASLECSVLNSSEYKSKIQFLVASNESLLEDLTKQLSVTSNSICKTFDLIIGVNTFRYACRLSMQHKCAQDIAALLAAGGYTIMIDMNDKFPFFRSKLRNRDAKPSSQTWLPSLEEYAEPFSNAGLLITQKKNFCWMPHSVNGAVYFASRILAPFLDAIVPSYAMRSLVVAKKH